MSDNQLVHEIIRDVGYAIKFLNTGESGWFIVKNDGNDFYTARASVRIPCGKSETSRAIQKAYEVTRGKPDPRDTEINKLTSRVAELEAALVELMDKASECDSWESFPEQYLEDARNALKES